VLPQFPEDPLLHRLVRGAVRIGGGLRPGLAREELLDDRAADV
jgi:hypothetical protein